MFELNCCAIPLKAIGGRSTFSVLTGAVAGPDLDTHDGTVYVSLTGGLGNSISFVFLHGGSCRDWTVFAPSVVASHRCFGRKELRSRGKTHAASSRVRARSAGLWGNGKSGGFAKIKQLSVHSAWCRCQHQSHPSARHTNSRTHIKERCVSNLSTLPKCLQSWPLFWTNLGAHNQWRRSSEWIWVGQLWKRSSPRFCTAADQAGRASATGRPRPDAPHSTHPSRISQSHHCGARNGGARRSGASSRSHPKVYPLLHSGHLRSLRWISVMVTGGPRREEYWRIRRPAHDTLFGMLESATKAKCSERPTPAADQSSTGHLPKFQQSSHGTGTLRDSKARTHGIGRWSGCPGPVLDQTSLRRDKPFKSNFKNMGTEAQRTERARQTKTGSRDAGPAHPRGRARYVTLLILHCRTI